MTNENIKTAVTDVVNALLITLKDNNDDFARKVKEHLEDVIEFIDDDYNTINNSDYYSSDDYYGSY